MKFVVVPTGRCRLCARTGSIGTAPDVYNAPPDFVCIECDPRTYEIVTGVKLPSGSLP